MKFAPSTPLSRPQLPIRTCVDRSFIFAQSTTLAYLFLRLFAFCLTVFCLLSYSLESYSLES
jgi:hypothetical protein